MLVTDLSDWNDHINWSHMIGEGVEGVIVKISEGRKKRQRSSLKHWVLWDTERRLWEFGSM